MRVVSVPVAMPVSPMPMPIKVVPVRVVALTVHVMPPTMAISVQMVMHVLAMRAVADPVVLRRVMVRHCLSSVRINASIERASESNDEDQHHNHVRQHGDAPFPSPPVWAHCSR